MGVGMDGVCNLSGNASSTGWFLGDTVWDGNLFTPFSTQNRATIIPMTTLTPGDHLNQVAAAMNGLNLVNPLPISASISVPDLAVVGNTVATSTGALSGTTFSTFCTVETEAMSWILMLVPGAKGVVSGLALSGSYPVPGTGAVVGWDFAKIYADMNLGFTADYRVTPTASLGVDVYTVGADGSETLYRTASGSALSFPMPNSRIRVRPRVSLDLGLASNLGFGMQGEIGTSPIKLTLDGLIGSGSRAESYHVDFDPAHLAWTSDPKGLARIKSGTVALGHADQTFDGTYVSLANLNDLPPSIYPGTAAGTNANGDLPLEIDAFALDPDTSGDPRLTVSFAPEQGYTYFFGSAGSGVSAEAIPAAPGGDEAYFDPIPPFVQGQQTLRMQFHSRDLRPGRYTLHTTVQGTNRAGAFKRADYRTRLNVNFAKGVLDGEFFREGNPAYAVNRVLADGTDQTVGFFARRLYHETEVVMNGSVVLPRDNTQNEANSINDGQNCRFTVPADVARRFAGSLNTVQLRTRDLSGDGTGFVLSDPKPLFIVAGAPTLAGIQFKDATNASLPLGDQAVTFEADGTNLSQASTVSALWMRNGVATTTALPTAYATPTALRVTLSTEFLADFHAHSSDGGLKIQAATPLATVPGDHYNTQTLTSGGASSPLAVRLAHLRPTITRFEPGILVKDSGAQTIRVYGDNLLRDPSAFYAAGLAAGFGQGATVAYPSGSGLSVPYLLVSLPANHPAIVDAGQNHMHVDYRDAASQDNDLLTEYGASSVSTATTYRLVMGASGADLSLTGAPFYDGDTRLFVNGYDLGTQVPTPTSIVAHVPANIGGATASVRVANPTPGGGDSNTVSVALLEGDASAVRVVPGSLVFDRASNAYKQSFAVTYVGTRDVSGGARLVFTSVAAGVTLVNASGTLGGQPYLSTSLVPRRQVLVVATWRKATSGIVINSATNVAFPY